MTQNEAGSVFQETQYYPFGLTMQGLGKSDISSPKNKYLYNGKEMQDDSGRIVGRVFNKTAI